MRRRIITALSRQHLLLIGRQMVSEQPFNSHKRQQRSESVILGFRPWKKKTEPYTRELDFYVHNLFHVGENMMWMWYFLLLSTSLHSLRCSREPPYNNFTSPKLPAWTDRSKKQERVMENMDSIRWEWQEILTKECIDLTVIKHSRLRCRLHTSTAIQVECWSKETRWRLWELRLHLCSLISPLIGCRQMAWRESGQGD